MLKNSGYFTKKVFTIKFAMPPVGTVVYNTLECLPYTVTEAKPVVLIGTRGEMWTFKLEQLPAKYKFATGEPITPALLQQKMARAKVESFTVPGKVVGSPRDIKLDMKTIAITSLPGAELYYGERVPVGQQFQCQAWGMVLNGNMPIDPNTGKKVQHGKGDYRMTPIKPDGSRGTTYIINGAVMEDTYKEVKGPKF